jgi:hypothetical protein
MDDFQATLGRWSICIICMLTLFVVLPSNVIAGLPTIPNGVFALMQGSAPTSSSALANPDVDGISLRTGWEDVNPSEDVYNWSYFDTEIPKATNVVKKVLIRVIDSYGDSTCRNAENGAPCDAATVLTHSVERAYEYGWNYLEIYNADIVGLPSVIHYAHTLLAQSSPTPAPTPTPTPTPGPTPTVTISSSLQRVSKGGSASFIISAQPAPSQPITVHYLMRGRALLGSDYTLSGTPGQATIPAGQSSASIILNALTDNIHEKNERAIMTLSPGSGYQLPRRNKRAKKATIRISNAP